MRLKQTRHQALLATVSIIALVGAAGIGCSGEGKGDAPVDDGAVASVPESMDGRLTSSSGEVISDYGPREDRVAAVMALDRLQDDFRAGRMRAACNRVSDFLLSQFVPPGTSDDSPCVRKLAAYAAQRARRGDRPRRVRLLWVRTYTVQAGIWVREDGEPLRIQLSSEPGVGWLFDLGAMNRPDLLAAILVGADDYPER